MDAFRAGQQFLADADVRHVTVPNDGASDGQRPLGIVGGFTDSPHPFRVTGIPRNLCARSALEPVDTLWIPAQDILTRQGLSLFADGIACGDTLEATDNAIQD